MSTNDDSRNKAVGDVKTDIEADKRLNDFFSSARSETIPDCSSILATRILKRLGSEASLSDSSLKSSERENALAFLNERLQRSLFIWRFVGSISLFTTAAILVFFFWPQTLKKSISIPVNVPVVIHVEVDETLVSRVTDVAMEIPDGVHFYSDEFPDLKEMKSLKMGVEVKGHGRYRLPFVLVSKSKGNQLIKIKYMDAREIIIREEFITIQTLAGDSIYNRS